jgi:wyosine [tRNA(Phe)-imidazoG37] synthetase (radical SAM superfamily)
MSNKPVSAKRLKYVYGPVPSWRLGSSLGIDLLSQKEKICTFDCIYCQLGATPRYTLPRRSYVHGEEIVRELDAIPEMGIDYITFSGRGEPTLASNLGSVVDMVRSTRNESICVITNSSFMRRKDVREELSHADFVIAKLDASSQESFTAINKPFSKIDFSTVVEGIKEFKRYYRGRLGLQIMFMDDNVQYAKDIAEIVREINPDEVQINTPLRGCAIKPLEREELSQITNLFGGSNAMSLLFGGLNVVSVYDGKTRYVKPISGRATLKRRGKE